MKSALTNPRKHQETRILSAPVRARCVSRVSVAGFMLDTPYDNCWVSGGWINEKSFGRFLVRQVAVSALRAWTPDVHPRYARSAVMASPGDPVP
jgi:hypothetical protein